MTAGGGDQVARREHDLVELLDRIESEWARAATGSDSPAG